VLSPIARIGVEEVSRRGEIVSPERLRALIRQSTEARIRDSFLVAACTNCWEYVELKKVEDIGEEEEEGERGRGLVACPRCGKTDSIGFSKDSYEEVFGAAMKARSRTNLNAKSLKLIEALRKTAALTSEYGQDFVFLFAGRGIRIAEAADLAAKKKKEGGNIIDHVIEGEREALRRRYFATG
jgi:hypothetical protein